MALKDKVTTWIKENAPMLTKVYENKYVEMAYDRFASLPPHQQKQVTLGAVGGVAALVLGYLMLSYWSLWSYSSQVRESEQMVTLLRDHQRQTSQRGQEIEMLERGNQLAPRGALKQHLLAQGKNCNISQRMLQVEEQDEPTAATGDGKGKQDIQMKQAKVTLQRVNLDQLKAFLENVEFSPYNLSVSSLKITNDDKIRGYMNVEMSVVAYLFQPGSESL